MNNFKNHKLITNPNIPTVLLTLYNKKGGIFGHFIVTEESSEKKYHEWVLASWLGIYSDGKTKGCPLKHYTMDENSIITTNTGVLIMKKSIGIFWFEDLEQKIEKKINELIEKKSFNLDSLKQTLNPYYKKMVELDIFSN